MSEGIHELLKIGETENVEFKETDNEAFYKTLSAFSNGEGGTVVLGVNDRGEVKGIKPSGQYITDLTNRIVNNLSIRPRIKTHEIKSKRILTVEVEKGQDLVGYKGHYYTRVGNTTREMTPKELRRKLLSDVQWDALSDDFSLDEIDTETVKRFITNKEYQEINNISRQMATIDLSILTEKEILVRTGKAGKGITYQLPKLTNKRLIIDQSYKEYFKKTAEGVILEYIRGIRKKAALNWALGSLMEMVEHKKLSFDEIQNIISNIEGNPSLYLLDSKRKEKLKELEKKLVEKKNNA